LGRLVLRFVLGVVRVSYLGGAMDQARLDRTKVRDPWGGEKEVGGTAPVPMELTKQPRKLPPEFREPKTKKKRRVLGSSLILQCGFTR